MADKLYQKTTELPKLIRALRCAAMQGKSHDVYCVSRNCRTLNTAEKMIDSLIYRKD